MKCPTMRPVLVAVSFGLVSCSSPAEVSWDGEPLLRTHGTEFQVIHTSGVMKVSIPYTFTNHIGSPVLLANCRGGISTSLEMKRRGKWVTAWSPILLLCASPPIQIREGAEYGDTLHVFAVPFGSAGGPQFAFVDVEGTYRLRWDAAYTEGNSHGGALPLRFRVSNEIFLKDP
jgi:hypothetical protein